MIHVIPESRAFGLIPMTVGISFLFILLFTILNSFFSSLSFVQLSVASLLIAALYMVLVVLHFINVSAKTLIDSLQNDCDVLEIAVLLSVFVHPNKESLLLEECRSRYAGSRKSHFYFRKRLMNCKLIYYFPLLLSNPSSQKCASCSLSRVYKSLNHRINHSKFTLSRDGEKILALTQ